MGTVTKMRGELQAAFERIVGHKIVECAVFDGELVLVLDDNAEVCVYLDDYNMILQVNEPLSDEEKKDLH